MSEHGVRAVLELSTRGPDAGVGGGKRNTRGWPVSLTSSVTCCRRPVARSAQRFFPGSVFVTRNRGAFPGRGVSNHRVANDYRLPSPNTHVLGLAERAFSVKYVRNQDQTTKRKEDLERQCSAGAVKDTSPKLHGGTSPAAAVPGNPQSPELPFDVLVSELHCGTMRSSGV
jgi:hypothetical protein